MKNLQYILLSIIFGLLSFYSNAQTVYTVTKTTDPNPYIYTYNFDDALCSPEMYGTLQWAIRKSNDTEGPCEIVFNIQEQAPIVISVNYIFPQITNSVSIDATTQSGYIIGQPAITLNGNTSIHYCFSLYNVDNIKISGFNMERFKGANIVLNNCTNADIEDNIITLSNSTYGQTKVGFSRIHIVNCENINVYGNNLKILEEGSTPLGVYSCGIALYNSINCSIGSPEENKSNEIFDCYYGVFLDSSQNIKISANEIYNNTEGISLNYGSNDLKKSPIILAYEEGIINGIGEIGDIIEVFGSTGNENSNEYLGTVTADENGDWSIYLTTSFDYLIATATDEYNNTSELSTPILVSPTCTRPTNLSATEGVATSHTLSWDGPSGVTYNVAIGVEELNPLDDNWMINYIQTSDTSVTISGLDENTEYEFYVNANCGTELSYWAGACKFNGFKDCLEIEYDISSYEGVISIAETTFNHDDQSMPWYADHITVCSDAAPIIIYSGDVYADMMSHVDYPNIIFWCGECTQYDYDDDQCLPSGILVNPDCNLQNSFSNIYGPIAIFDPSNVEPGEYAINSQYDFDWCFMERVYITVLDTDPTITPIGPFCENDASVLLQAVDEGGTWSGNGVTSDGMFYPENAGPGQHIITYTIEEPCPASDEITITVFESPDPEIEDVFVCINGNATFFTDEENPDAIESYAWSGPNGDGPNSDTWFLENVQPSMEGEYTVTVTFEYDDITCTGTGSGHLTVHENPTITFNEPAICNETPSLLTAEGGTSYLWNNGETSSTITITDGGTYSVVATDEYGCTNEESIDVPESNLIMTEIINNPSCENENTGSIGVVTGGGYEPYTYYWNGSGSFTSNSPIINNLEGGAYSVTVTDQNDCTLSAEYNVDIIESPEISFENIVPSCTNISENGSATIVLNGGTGAEFQFLWPNGQTTQTGTQLNAGPNTVTVTDEFDCPTTATVIIPTSNLSANVITSNSIVCLGGDPATITAIPSGGIAPYTYNWNEGLSNLSEHTITPIITTEYWVTVTDAHDCITTASVEIDVIEIDVIIKNPEEEICLGGTVRIGAHAEGDEITYLWSPEESLDDPSAPSPYASPTETTTYTVIAEDANGCQGTGEVTVTVHPIPEITVTGPTDICAGYEFHLEASGAESYFWESSSSTATISDPEIPNPIITIDETTTFIVSGWSEHECKGIAEITITALENPEPELDYNDHVCIGDDIFIDLTNEVFNTYSWEGPNGYTSTDPDVLIDNITDLNIGTYNVEVEYTNGCTNSAQATIETHIFVAHAGNNSPCVGEELHLSARPIDSEDYDYTYHWEGPDAYNADYDISEHHVPGATTDMAGTYYVTVTDQYGCTASAQTEVVVHENPVVDLGPDALICIGESIYLGENLIITGAETNIFEWLPTDWINDDVTIANPNASPEESIVYTLVATDIYGCSGTDDIAITVDEILNLSATSNSPVCENGELHLYAQPDGLSYQWTGPSGFTSTEQDPVVTNSADPDLHAGTYTLSVENINECSSTVSINVEIYPVPEVIVGPDQTICEGTELSLTGGIDGLTGYHWTGPNGYESFEQNPTVSSSATSLMEGTYTLVVSNEFDCTAEASCYIEIKPTPTAASFDLPSCIFVFNDYQFINLGNNDDGFEYTWDFGDGVVSNEASPIHEFRSEGYHCLTLTVENECGISTYMTEPQFLYPNECACITEYNVDFVPITGSNEYWNPAYSTVEKDIIIETGACLTIDNQTIQFGPEGRIIVNQGGTLIFDNDVTLRGLESCDNMWQGIEVWGDHESDYDDDIQGQIIFNAGKHEILDAHIGLLLGARNTEDICNMNITQAFNNNLSGGYLQIKENASFIDNGIGIKILRKANGYQGTGPTIGYQEIHIATESTSLIDNNYNSVTGVSPYPNQHNPWAGKANSLQRTDVGIWMENVKIQKIRSCTFENIQYGILSYDSFFNIYKSSFNNAVYGIRIENLSSGTGGGHEIAGCEFYSILGTGDDDFEDITSSGIFINSSYNNKIQGNVFGDEESFQDENNIGIFTFNALSLNIIQNEFNSQKKGIFTANLVFGPGFIPVTNLPTNKIGAGANTINNITSLNDWDGNTFTACNTSIYTWLDNRNLKIKCNNCKNSQVQNEYYSNFENEGAMANIGAAPIPFFSLSFLNVKRPGGNEFSPFEEYHNGYYKTISSNSEYEYFAHAGPLKVIPTSHNESIIDMEDHIHTSYVTKPENPVACDERFAISPNLPYIEIAPITGSKNYPYNLLDSIKNEVDSLQSVKEEINNNLDGGITNELIENIQSNMPSGRLKNKLISNSPLSDEVIFELLTNYPLAHGDFKNVMMKNLPVSKDLTPLFYDVMENIPAGISQQLIELQGIKSQYNTLTSIEREMEYLNLERGYVLSTLLYYLTDTLNNRKDDALLLLEYENSDWANATLAASYFKEGDYAYAREKLLQIESSDQLVTDFIDYQNMMLDVYEEERTIYQMDSSETAFIRELAYKCPAGLASTNAQSILSLLYRESVPTCPSLVGTRNMQVSNNSIIREDIYKDDNNNVYLGENYPDPASDYTIIPYNLPDEISGFINIIDATGKNVYSSEINSENAELNINTIEFVPGTYTYTLVSETGERISKKMIIHK